MNEVKLSPFSKKLIMITCLGLAAGSLIKVFLFDILHVSGLSMEPAIHNKSTLAVNKLAYGLNCPGYGRLLLKWNTPNVNDIVIYLYNNKIVVKRCVATEGQLLEYSTDPVYNLTVGDKNIPLTAEQYIKMKNCNSVPEGYILAIGDNYSESIDSRNYGFVSTGSVLGKVLWK